MPNVKRTMAAQNGRLPPALMTMIRLRGTAMTVLVPFPSLHTTFSLLRELGRKSHAGGSGRGRPRAGRACGCEPRAQLSGVGKVATTLTAASSSSLRALSIWLGKRKSSNTACCAFEFGTEHHLLMYLFSHMRPCSAKSGAFHICTLTSMTRTW